MMTTARSMATMINSFSSIVLLFLPCVCWGLASNPVQSFLQGLELPGYNFGPSPPPTAQAQDVLQKLNLAASTDPVLAGVAAQDIPNILLATTPTLLRAASGVFAQEYNLRLVPRDDAQYAYVASADQQTEETGVYKPPVEPIVLYDFESCPYCRKVREACSMLSLPVTFKPTPRNGRTYRPEIKTEFGSSATFPYMVDPNTGSSMFESDKIINYLFKVYGNGDVPWTLRENSPWVPLSASLGVGLARMGAGGSYQFSNPPEQPLHLWAYEGSPFCKVVREKLCALEIPHTVIHTPRGSENRARLWKRVGRFQVPYLEDPNTTVSLFESQAILEYIDKQYGVAPSPVNVM